MTDAPGPMLKREWTKIAALKLQDRGYDARFFDGGRSYDGISIHFRDGGYYLFTPWFYEVETGNFGISSFDADDDLKDACTLDVDIRDFWDIADTIAEWMDGPAF